MTFGEDQPLDAMLEARYRPELSLEERELAFTYFMRAKELPVFPATRRQFITAGDAGYGWARGAGLYGPTSRAGIDAVGRMVPLLDAAGGVENPGERALLLCELVVETRGDRFIFDEDSTEAAGPEDAFAGWRSTPGNDWQPLIPIGELQAAFELGTGLAAVWGAVCEQRSLTSRRQSPGGDPPRGGSEERQAGERPKPSRWWRRH